MNNVKLQRKQKTQVNISLISGKENGILNHKVMKGTIEAGCIFGYFSIKRNLYVKRHIRQNLKGKHKNWGKHLQHTI